MHTIEMDSSKLPFEGTLQEYVNIYVFHGSPYDTYSQDLFSVHVRRTASEWSRLYGLELDLVDDLPFETRNEVLYYTNHSFWEWACLYTERILRGPRLPEKPVSAISYLEMMGPSPPEGIEHPRKRSLRVILEEFNLEIDDAVKERILEAPQQEFTNAVVKELIAHFIRMYPPTEETKVRVATAVAKVAQVIDSEAKLLSEYKARESDILRYRSLQLECERYQHELSVCRENHRRVLHTFIVAVRKFTAEAASDRERMDVIYNVRV